MKYCAVLMLTLFGCAADGYDDYNESLHDTMKYATPEAMAAHTLLLGTVLARAEENGVQPPPGVAAEYGFNTALMGDIERGVQYMDKEMVYYPESKLFVEALKRIIENRENILINEKEEGK